MNDPPFTPARLAIRWECTEQAVSALCRSRKLRAFKIGGKLWRIPADEVARWEKGETTSASDGTGGSSAPSSAEDAADSAARSARLTGDLQSEGLQSFERLMSGEVVPLSQRSGRS